MAGAALLSLREEDAGGRRIAAAILCILGIKVLVEAATGHLLLELVHLGELGRPNRLCHLGGVVGGTLGALACDVRRFRSALTRDTHS